MSVLDTRSPELAYATKSNIVIPVTVAQATALAERAAQIAELNRNPGQPTTIARTTNVDTVTYLNRRHLP